MKLDIYKTMKKCNCKTVPLLREGDVDCREVKLPRLTGSVIFETDTGTVYDKDGNYIGKGTMKDGFLTIEMDIKK